MVNPARTLLQAAIHTTLIPETMAVAQQNHDLGDGGELGKRLVNLRSDARVGANAWGGRGAAELQRRGPLLGGRTFLVQGEREVWPALCQVGPNAARRWAS